MYAALWRRLPGPLAVRVLTAFALLALAVLALCVWVFPAVEAHVPWGEVTVR